MCYVAYMLWVPLRTLCSPILTLLRGLVFSRVAILNRRSCSFLNCFVSTVGKPFVVWFCLFCFVFFGLSFMFSFCLLFLLERPELTWIWTKLGVNSTSNEMNLVWASFMTFMADSILDNKVLSFRIQHTVACGLRSTCKSGEAVHGKLFSECGLICR